MKLVDLDKLNIEVLGEHDAILRNINSIEAVTEEDIVRPYLDKLKNQLIQDIQNGVIHISSGNEKLFVRIEGLLRR